MSRSGQPPSPEDGGAVSPGSIDASERTPHGHVPPTPAERAVRQRHKWKAKLAGAFRWLHIYLSMIGLAMLLFFSVTGLTLNHPGWFYDGAMRSVEAEGTLEPSWVKPGPEENVARLEVVEHLRSAHGVRGALSEFRVDDFECMVVFKGPGYAADAFIDRESGRYRFSETGHGLVAILNDLHKGRDTGPVWSVFIDVSAVLTALMSLTGLGLLLFLKRRRVPGLVTALVGTVIVVLLALLFVP
jgi:hypothetical protein